MTMQMRRKNEMNKKELAREEMANRELELKPVEWSVANEISDVLINKIKSTIEFFAETECEVLGMVALLDERRTNENEVSRFLSVKMECDDATLYAPIARFIYSRKDGKLIYIEIFTAGESLNLAYTWHIP